MIGFVRIMDNPHLLFSLFDEVEVCDDGAFVRIGKDIPPFPMGVASSPFVARLAGDKRIERGEEAHFVGPLPLDVLPVEAETIRRLKLLGFRLLADLRTLSYDDLALQFGEEGEMIYLRCRGIDETPLSPTRPPHSLEGSLDLEEGDIERDLMGPLFSQLDQRLVLRMHFSFSSGQTLQVGFSKPTSSPQKALRLFKERLATLSFDEAPATLHVALDTVAATFHQLSFLGQERRRVIEACAHLRPNALMQCVWDEPRARLRERRAHLESLLADSRRPLCVPRPINKPHITKVIERWRVEEDWWTARPIHRDYLHVRIRGGADKRVFVENRQWFDALS